jgi:haloacetate dehalogenase
MTEAFESLLPGFVRTWVETMPGVRLAVSRHPGGRAKPGLLLLHGHPQTQAMWHQIAPAMLRTHDVVLMDLRGYGDSSRPPDGEAHAGYSKRAMAQDALAVMHAAGHVRFAVCAHDRGARVAHRLAVDHPDAVARLMLLDIAPTLGMYEHTSMAFAQAYWHWFFFIQPAPLPEALLMRDPVGHLRRLMGSRHGGLGVFHPAALAEYERCIQLPDTLHAICEDYRASAGIDLVHDREDVAAGRKLTQPLRVLWAEHGAVNRCFYVLALWAERADQVTGRTLPCGHYLAEERPDDVLAEMADFFNDSKGLS